MDFTILEYIIIIFASFLAGCINTLAGSGSAITLAILTEIVGLPGNLANGTNRVGVLSSGGLASYIFYKNGKLDIRKGKWIITFVSLGALIGVYVATQISNEMFREVFKYLMVCILFVVLIKPKRWLEVKVDAESIPIIIALPIYLAIGFYGGFIQMGMGVFFIAVLVLVSKYDLITGNAIKGFTVAFYTLFVVAVFQFNGLIDWKAGLLLAIGQTAGAYVTAIFASKYQRADVWAYRLLVLIVILIILHLFGIFSI